MVSNVLVFLANAAMLYTATEDNIHQGQYAIDLAEKIMPLYEQLFDLDYPLPKLDFLAVSILDTALPVVAKARTLIVK